MCFVVLKATEKQPTLMDFFDDRARFYHCLLTFTGLKILCNRLLRPSACDRQIVDHLCAIGSVGNNLCQCLSKLNKQLADRCVRLPPFEFGGECVNSFLTYSLKSLCATIILL